MTEQEVFDTVAWHLIRQNRPAMNAEDACLYRCEIDGQMLKCAVGILIPDENYSEALENENVFCPTVMEATGLPHRMRGLLDSLQQVHDSGMPECWPDKLRRAAREHSLSDEAVDAALAERGA